jgi:hypothetical protein
MTVAVDFTLSNGAPTEPTSLHYMRTDGGWNIYQQALISVSEILVCAFSVYACRCLSKYTYLIMYNACIYAWKMHRPFVPWSRGEPRSPVSQIVFRIITRTMRLMIICIHVCLYIYIYIYIYIYASGCASLYFRRAVHLSLS